LDDAAMEEVEEDPSYFSDNGFQEFNDVNEEI